MASYLVSFKDQRYVFHVVLQNQNDLDTIAEALQEVFRFPPPLVAGRAAAKFIYWASNGADVFLTRSPSRSQCVVEVDVSNRRVSFARSMSHGDRTPRDGSFAVEFTGTVDAFKKWVEAGEGTLVGKTVVFRYTGGSGIGNRVIKVDKVEEKRGTTYICGKDLKKGEYRCYDRRRIDGEILVLDENGRVQSA